MEYFKHNINASEDEKICELLANGGYELLGYYWRFIEYLYSRGGKANKKNLNGIAWSLHMDVDKLSVVICNYDLFYEDEEYIYSARVLKEVQEFEAVGKRMSEIGRSGGQASAKAKAQAEAKRAVENNQACGKRTVERTVSECLSDSQACAQQKKRKEKKIKENKIERMNEIEPCETHDQSLDRSEESEMDLFSPEYRLKSINGIGKGVVLLSDEQIADLLDKMTLEEFDRYVGIVAESELKGKHYKKKTHYQAILDMVKNDRRIRKT